MIEKRQKCLKQRIGKEGVYRLVNESKAVFIHGR